MRECGFYTKIKIEANAPWRFESLGNVRPEQVKRVARELMRLYADKFTTNFDNNKKVIQSLTNIPSTRLRNRVAAM